VHAIEAACERSEWQLVEVVTPSRTWRSPPGVDSVIRFDGEGEFSGNVCADMGGPARIDGDLVLFGTRVRRFAVGCGGALGAFSNAFDAFLGGRPYESRWRIEGEQLRLDKPGGRELRFRVRDTIFPTRDLRPLVRGRRGAADYQFGWKVDGPDVWLKWEWRDKPGKPWTISGQLPRPPTWRVERPGVVSHYAGANRFVFGLVRPATARVSYRPPDGRRLVELQVFTVPAARTWRAFGGFVPAPSKGGKVLALDARGRNLGWSDRIRSDS
jgi:hypothetical protein